MPTLQNQQLPAYPNQSTSGKGINWAAVSAVSSIIIFVLIIAVLGYWWLVIRPEVESQPPIQATSTKQASPSAKPATKSSEVDEKADWKTYTDTKTGYTLKYPKDWLSGTCEDKYLFLAPSKDILGICSSEFGGLINITSGESDYKDYISQFDDLSYFYNSSKKEITISGKDAIRVSGKYKESSNYVQKDALRIEYVINQGKGKILILNYYSKPQWGDYSKAFEKIVSTFRFD
ncbi:MAG: PsbP-related protein [Candidatus Woykebacteria bacterium]